MYDKLPQANFSLCANCFFRRSGALPNIGDSSRSRRPYPACNGTGNRQPERTAGFPRILSVVNQVYVLLAAKLIHRAFDRAVGHLYGLVIALGIWLGRIRIAGISWYHLGAFHRPAFLFPRSYHRQGTENFLSKGIRADSFVYAIGLQVGPGFWASLKKMPLPTMCTAAIVVTGVGIPFCCTISATTIFPSWPA